MQAVLAALRGLQEIDTHIFRAQAELKRLPQERATRKAELDKRSARIAEHKLAVMQLRSRIKELEDGTSEKRQRVRKVEAEAASSRQDMALLVAFQHEARTLKKEIGTLEEEGLGLLEKIDALEKESAAIAAGLEAEQKVFAEFEANMQREMDAAQAKLSELQEQRKQRSSQQIPADALGIYTKLLVAREGQALAVLEGRACQACFMDVPPNLVVRLSRGTELVQCPGCSRILYQGA